ARVEEDSGGVGALSDTNCPRGRRRRQRCCRSGFGLDPWWSCRTHLFAYLLALTGWAGKNPLNRKEQLDVASADEGAPQRRRDRVLFAGDQPLEKLLVGLNHA